MKSLLYVFLSLFVYSTTYSQDYVTVNRALTLMGTKFEITVVAENEEIGQISIAEAIAEIRRIEKKISSWNNDSETNVINKNAGIKPVKVSAELFQLITRAKQLSVITDGAFDISYASIDEIWKFDGSMKVLPTEKEVKRSIARIGYEKIILDEVKQSVFLKEKGMKIAFGAIGKGYAADKAKEFLVSKGVKGGIINASGDLTTWGTKANGEKWLVGIVNPLDKSKFFSWLPVVESSVATSGNYEKYFMYEGKRYSHIIDPRTGYPTSGVHSVSVFSKKAELCDALATAIFIMGTNTGLALINQLRGTDVIIVDSNNKIHKSNGIILDTNQ